VIRTTGLRRYAPGYEREVRSFLRWIEKNHNIPHRLDIEFVPKLYGMFVGPDRKVDSYGWPTLTVACDCSLDEVLDTIAHEFRHYLQWRDGKRQIEVGVDRGADRMLRDWSGTP
jgi:hypothetical protein